MGESGWTPPLPLESNANTEAPEDFNTKPVLIRARVPEWGTVHEITGRLELVGHGFERTLVRLQTHLQTPAGMRAACPQVVSAVKSRHVIVTSGATPPNILLLRKLTSCNRRF